MAKDYQNPTRVEQVRFFALVACVGFFITFLYNVGTPTYVLGWIAFSVACFAVAGNDAVQTIGTFIESKRSVPLFQKLLFLGLVFCLVFGLEWWLSAGRIDFRRLERFPPSREFHLIQLLSPLILVVITRLRSPVSTTFLILGLFGGRNVGAMLTKSFLGYGIAFAVAVLIWSILVKLDPKEYREDHVPNEQEEKVWAWAQWGSTMILWFAWIRQDIANIAVFLPRELSFLELSAFAVLFLASLSIILFTNGGTIQSIVREKSDLQWSKAATIVDLVYAGILILFQEWNSLPMSTTWVFLGLLSGREIILNVLTLRDTPYLETFQKVGKDVILAFVGILVSIGIFLLSFHLYPSVAKM